MADQRIHSSSEDMANKSITNQVDYNSLLTTRIYTPARMRRRHRNSVQKMNSIAEGEEGEDSMHAPSAPQAVNENKENIQRRTRRSRANRDANRQLRKISDSPDTETLEAAKPNRVQIPSEHSYYNTEMTDPLFTGIDLKSQQKSNTSHNSVDTTDAFSNIVNGNLKGDSTFHDKAKMLATLLPDAVLTDPLGRRNQYYNTAVIFPDVSGFTQLCEQYDKTGKGGPSRLTEVLNGYLGSMIQIVLSRNGDVFKFGGDAFFCIWKVPLESDIRQIVYLAIESAVDIQKNCGEHKTDVGVKLGVKIAVAAGRALLSVIGSGSRKHYVLVGSPVFDVREAELLCKSGDVIVSPSAWKYVENYMLYSYTYHSDNAHIRVHDFGPLWKPVQIPDGSLYTSNTEWSIRPVLKYVPKLKVEHLLPYILTPIMKSVQLNQSLDYLTEMRQVAITFFNVAVDYTSMTLEDIIELSNKAFQIVTAVVDKNDGAVNKLTLFDKDMAILAVFGLKGFKHELASQVALKSAYNCLEQLRELNVISASVGVTTGMTYCGVIGHVLRREYTVMGHPVNMAARLMCAYPNVVSCDRDTFLHSKLESGYFEVLEQKLLKGIENAGLYYKFNLQLKRKAMKLDLNASPMLGRTKEIHEFEKFFYGVVRNKSQVNFMTIYGKARIGKSRLVAEMVNIVENFNEGKFGRASRMPQNRIEIIINSLTEEDTKYSYSAIRLMFLPPIGLDETSSVEEREDKIISKLGEIREIHTLAALNPVFNVNFDLMPQYLNLTQQEQDDAQKLLIEQLYNKCFPQGTKWFIVIEDAEFMDDESWLVLQWCSHISYHVIYILTIGQRRVLSPQATSALASFNQKKVVLTEIEKWYYSSLAGQILGVQAIPVELESLMQNHKNCGNPGWMESFLLTLLQSGSIYIDQVSVNKVKHLKLVSAQLEKANDDDEKLRDASQWSDCVGTFESVTNTQIKLKVCVLGPNFFEHSKNETDLAMDIMFLKTIDALKPIEQLVLKVGSVLGNNFKRSALVFLMSLDEPIEERQLAKAIRNLFDMKILTCAKGDMVHTNAMVPRRMILVSSLRTAIKCECKGITIPSDCLDLPPYASCGYMQFRSPIFCETAYSLLLDDQKKKYHNGSIEYLRKNTSKCKFCNNQPFTDMVGIDDCGQMMLVCPASPLHGVRATKLDPQIEFPISSLKKKFLYCFNRTRDTRTAQSINIQFEKLEMGECQCAEILSSVYAIMLEHATSSGRKDILLEIQLEYASLSLTTYNIPLTMQLLEDALELVNLMNEEADYAEFSTPYIFSKIYTLMGATKFNMGRPEISLELLETSLRYMKKSLPKSKVHLKYLIKRTNMKRKMIMEYFPEHAVGQSVDEEAQYCDLLSECLGLICIVNMCKDDWLMAKYASAWALNAALKSNRNFFGLCTAYANMIDVAYHYKDLETCSKMEICAVDICRRCKTKIVELYELEAICRLFRVIFQARHIRAEIENAVFIGFQSIKIATVVRNTSLKLDVMPDLIFALIQLNRLSEAASLLQELEFTSQLDSDKSSRIWYYGISLDFQLDTGFTVIPYETCQQFVKEEEENFEIARDPKCKHRLYTSLWLWCIRHDEWELSKPYGKILKGYNLVDVGDTPTTVFTRLKRLEGFLITLVHKIDTRNIHGINSSYAEISSLMAKLEKDVQVVKLLKPRFLLYKAYYRQIKYRDDSCFRLLNQALSLAEKIKDKNTYEWIIHLQMVWNNAISPIQRDFWLEHCRNNLIDWHESEEVSKKQSVMFSLPLPKF